ncbi:hypothetical protein HFX_1091 [Haloferax mediterranei ATCC 33500]|uniref:Uncharacterized protein n=1 Tax=Haloferax mediterranei (strain ATCC 33500 / DSM 1411 / JCM 8866 / NBRC 14739 / NCIMB 2177 / R-4) TaxID=523841 RepID=I3R3J7_HALMT|nr:hypothetical protein HFX_1091 [Haloferax mediterranei ATCC 33500]
MSAFTGPCPTRAETDIPCPSVSGGGSSPDEPLILRATRLEGYNRITPGKLL